MRSGKKIKNKLKVILPRSKYRGINRFWNQLFFWATIYLSFKAYLKHKEIEHKARIKIRINGKVYIGKSIKIEKDVIFVDGKFISPEEIESLEIDLIEL